MAANTSRTVAGTADGHSRTMPAVTRVERGRARGQTLVEFALVLPVFVVLTLGVLDAARVFSAHVAISNSAREAAMFASRGTNSFYWCRNPADPASADPDMPVSVSCPSGAGAGNYSADPNNIGYRIAAETDGLDRTRITLDPPRCSLGAGVPGATCTAGTTPKYVLVRVTYQMDLVTPLISQIWGKPVSITAVASARIDQ